MWKIKGKFKGTEYKNGKYLVTFETNSLGDKPNFDDIDLSIKVDKYYPPKSRNANGYYWQLLTLISDETSKNGTYTSVNHIHNLHLRNMWQEILKVVDGSVKTSLIPNTDKAELDALEDPDCHLMPVPVSLMADPIYINSKGKEFRWYMELRGCRTFDSKEFSRLVSMAVQDAKALGIETLDDIELKRLVDGK